VADIEAARSELVGRGVDASEVFHSESGRRRPGPDPRRADYGSFLSFDDPDGNGWLVQEVRRDLGLSPAPTPHQGHEARRAVDRATMRPLLELTDAWRATYPGAAIGLLAMTSVRNPPPGADLLARVEALAAEVRARHAGRSRTELENLPAMRPYVGHYRRFGKTYHLLLQLESVAFRGRPPLAADSLVTAMFAAEIDHLLLTAGHDLDALRPPLVADVTRPGDRYIGIGGKVIETRPGDMCIRDGEGIVSAVLHGPDRRTRLLPTTESVLFTTYAPAGITDAELGDHLRAIEELVRAGSPSAITELLDSRRA